MELIKDQQDLIFIETTGFSMWPFLKNKEKLIFKKVPIDDLQIGDILLYRDNGDLVSHRLVKKSKNKDKNLIFVRGDNSLSAPKLLTEQMFLAKAIGILKNGKVNVILDWRYRFINRLIVIVAPIVSNVVKVVKKLFLLKK